MFERGKIILVPFPFTDLSAQKVRPALIISRDPLGEDVIVCFISSKLSPAQAGSPAQVVVKEADQDFGQTGLKVASVIRVDKIATLDRQIVLGELGSLPVKYMKQVNQALKEVLDF